MNTFEYSRRLWGREITAQVLVLEQGIHISLFGGTLSHIGAVSIADPEGKVSTLQFPGHKESLITKRWAEELARLGYLPAVVEAGIHYDGLSREQIAEVVEETERLLTLVLTELAENHKT